MAERVGLASISYVPAFRHYETRLFQNLSSEDVGGGLQPARTCLPTDKSPTKMPPRTPRSLSPRSAAFTKMFTMMDADCNGQIDEAEAMAIGRKLSGGNTEMARAFWQELLAAADSNKSGTVSLDEYLRYSRDKTKSHPIDQVVSSVQMSLARLEEMKARDARQQSYEPLAKRPTDRREMAERVFRYADSDNDGFLQLHELLKLSRSDEEELLNLPQLFTIMDMEGFKQGNGKLSLDEWLTMAEDMSELSDEKFEQSMLAVIESAFGAPGAVAVFDRKLEREKSDEIRAQRARGIFQELLAASGDGAKTVDLVAHFQRAETALENETTLGEDQANRLALAKAEFDDMQSETWAGADGRVSESSWVQGLMRASEELGDNDFEVRCRKITRHLRLSPDFSMRIQKSMELFKAIDLDMDGRLELHEVLRLISYKNSAKLAEAVPLFFEHLDSGASGSKANDGYITNVEWQSGFLGSMAHKTDFEFVELCDGMLAHLAKSPLAGVKH